MKLTYPLAALLCLGSLLPAAAQQAPATALPAAIPAMTHADSAAVLQDLFQRNRWIGRYAGLLEGAVLPIAVVGAASPSPQSTRFQQGSMILSAGILAVNTVSCLVRWSRFSQRREHEALQRFEQHQPQPRYVTRKFNQVVVAKQLAQLRHR